MKKPFAMRMAFLIHIMIMRIFILSILMAISVNSPGISNENMVWLEKSGTKVGVLISRGGRIVFLSKNNSPNLLKSDSALWNETDADRPTISGNSGWKEYNGHIVWVGPQSEWWTRQDINPERKKFKAVWPPDPYLIYGQYKILENTSDKLVIRGPVSEISGLSLKKSILIDQNGDVLFEVEATNMRREAVSWDLWLNTRLSGFAKAYVPVEKMENITIDSEAAENSGDVKWTYCEDYFSYLPAEPESPFTISASKAYITPSSDWMAAFIDDYCLKIEFPSVDPEKIHPNQAIVEIYNRTSTDKRANLTELEFHSEYKTLQPGASFKTSEKWKVYKYDGKSDEKNQIKFLDQNFRK
jgi:hypothetical protein